MAKVEKVLTALNDNLANSVDRHGAGFYFEEGGCWAFAVALKTILDEVGIKSSIQSMRGFRHAMVKVGDAVIDHQGARPADRYDTHTVSPQEVAMKAVAAQGPDQFEADLAWATEIIKDALP